jgi:hypothetical protein
MPTTKREKTVSLLSPFSPFSTFPLILWCYFRRLNSYACSFLRDRVRLATAGQRALPLVGWRASLRRTGLAVRWMSGMGSGE